MAACEHIDQIKNVEPLSAGCADCLALGDTWVNLRMCRTCGYVGCCDSSKNKHARQHFHVTTHPLIRSQMPGETWTYCFVDDVTMDPGEEPPPPAETPPAALRIIRNYLVLAGLYTLSASLIWGVNTLFLLDAGLSLFQVFIANAVFTGSMAIFEIPTGVLADTRGRRMSFLLSVAVLVIGTLGYVGVSLLGGGLWWFILMSIVLGLGYTFYSGAMEAWLVDALKSTGFSGQLDRVFARSAFVSGIAMLIGTVGGGFLGDVHLAIPFATRAVLLVIVFVIAFIAMHDLGYEPRALSLSAMPTEMRRVAVESVTYGWQQKPVRFLIIASMIQAVFMAWGWYAWQPYFLELLGQNLTWVAGVISALVALSIMAGNSLVEWITRFCGKRTTLLIWAAGVQTVAIIGVGLANSFYLAVGFFLIAMATTGVYTPVRQAYMHQIIPSEQRATVISFDSLMASGGSVLGQSGLGYLSQVRSIPAGYVVSGITTVLVLPVLAILRRTGDDADLIVGTAGGQNACAASGLPGVASVDTTTVVPVGAEAK